MSVHKDNKIKLRRQAHALADSSAARHRLDADICKRFIEAFAPDPKKILSFFWPMARECDTRLIAETCSDMGMVCALPVIRTDGHGLVFRQWMRGGPMVRSKFGTMEPTADAPELVPDVMLVPLVMIDLHGTRLGRGAGHYDATLADLRQKKNFMAIGIAYDWQVSDDEALPLESHDQRLDGVVTPTRVLLFP